MKKFACTIVCLSALALPPVFGQITNLTTFNLDFPGGTPAELVTAIEKAIDKPLNAIIPTADTDIQLPPLKMNDVTTPKLFDALGAASRQTVAVKTGLGGGFSSYSQTETGYGFRTSDNPSTDTSIWYFFADKPIMPPVISTAAICKFYQLQPYLNHGFTVDDITTAIQTGWKMAGIASPPELNYHKETNLLIAFGKPDDLATIQNVLDTLPQTYIDKSRMDYYFNKAEDLESKIRKLSEQVSALSTNSPASSEKNSGK